MNEDEKTSVTDKGRRKAIKALVGGVSAITAYHAFPTKWGTPIVEQIFLPAHAATSGVIETPDTPPAPPEPEESGGGGSSCCGNSGSFTVGGGFNGGDTITVNYTTCSGASTVVHIVGNATPVSLPNVDITQSVTVTSSNNISGISNQNNISLTNQGGNTYSGTVSSCGNFSFQVDGVN